MAAIGIIFGGLSIAELASRNDKAGGIIYGLLRGLIITYVALLLIGFAGQINENNSYLLDHMLLLF